MADPGYGPLPAPESRIPRPAASNRKRRRIEIVDKGLVEVSISSIAYSPRWTKMVTHNAPPHLEASSKTPREIYFGDLDASHSLAADSARTRWSFHSNTPSNVPKP